MLKRTVISSSNRLDIKQIACLSPDLILVYKIQQIPFLSHFIFLFLSYHEGFGGYKRKRRQFVIIFIIYNVTNSSLLTLQIPLKFFFYQPKLLRFLPDLIITNYIQPILCPGNCYINYITVNPAGGFNRMLITSK